MAKPPRRANYRHKLTHPLTLQDGRKLATLRDGANVLLDVFECGQRASPGVPDLSVRRPLKAAQQRQLRPTSRRRPTRSNKCWGRGGCSPTGDRRCLSLARSARDHSGGVCCTSFSYRKNGEHAVLGGNGKPTNGTAGKLETPRDAPQHGEVVESATARPAGRLAMTRYGLSVCGSAMSIMSRYSANRREPHRLPPTRMGSLSAHMPPEGAGGPTPGRSARSAQA